MNGCMYERTHLCMHDYICIHSHTHACACVCDGMIMRVHICAGMHACINLRLRTHACTCTHAYACVHVHMHVCAHARAHGCTIVFAQPVLWRLQFDVAAYAICRQAASCALHVIAYVGRVQPAGSHMIAVGCHTAGPQCVGRWAQLVILRHQHAIVSAYAV